MGVCRRTSNLVVWFYKTCHCFTLQNQKINRLLKMELLQIFTIAALIFLDFASSQSLRRTVTQSSSSCTDAVKDYIGAQDGDTVEINYTGCLRDTAVSGGTWRK